MELFEQHFFLLALANFICTCIATGMVAPVPPLPSKPSVRAPAYKMAHKPPLPEPMEQSSSIHDCAMDTEGFVLVPDDLPASNPGISSVKCTCSMLVHESYMYAICICAF